MVPEIAKVEFQLSKINGLGLVIKVITFSLFDDYRISGSIVDSVENLGRSHGGQNPNPPKPPPPSLRFFFLQIPAPPPGETAAATRKPSGSLSSRGPFPVVPGRSRRHRYRSPAASHPCPAAPPLFSTGFLQRRREEESQGRHRLSQGFPARFLQCQRREGSRVRSAAAQSDREVLSGNFGQRREFRSAKGISVKEGAIAETLTEELFQAKQYKSKGTRDKLSSTVHHVG
ncbi:hypothetical protein Droror1_Dr00023982 [Drosera rotundifolia]